MRAKRWAGLFDLGRFACGGAARRRSCRRCRAFENLALEIAADYARRRDLDAAGASVAALSLYDQWTVPNGFDRHRPLYRVALDDRLGTELYVSSVTGEIVLDTDAPGARLELFRQCRALDLSDGAAQPSGGMGSLFWWLSFLALIGASAGAAVGMLRIRVEGSRLTSPYRGWQAWHHWLGLMCMLFVLTWIFSGWLSMDDGRLFSTGKPSRRGCGGDCRHAGVGALPPTSYSVSPRRRRRSSGSHSAGGYTAANASAHRPAAALSCRRASVAGDVRASVFATREIDDAASRLARACKASFVVDRADDYAVASSMPTAPLFRVVCGDDLV